MVMDLPETYVEYATLLFWLMPAAVTVDPNRNPEVVGATPLSLPYWHAA